MNIKTCSKCHRTQSTTEFRRDKNYKSGRRGVCRICMNAYQKEWYQKNPEKRRSQKFRYQYGITVDQYNTLLAQQNGCCKICQSSQTGDKHKKFLFVDHCHTTNKVRGLLCSHCNRGLGAFKDDPKRLQNAISYLTRPAKCDRLVLAHGADPIRAETTV